MRAASSAGSTGPGGDPEHAVVGDVEIGTGGADHGRHPRLHRARERPAHLTSVGEAQVDHDVGRGQPPQEVGIVDIGVNTLTRSATRAASIAGSTS